MFSHDTLQLPKKQSVIEVATIDASALHLAAFKSSFKFDTSDNINYFEQVCKDARKDRTKLHVLKINGVNVGLIAISIQCMEQKFNQKKYLNIDYVFVDNQYRKIIIEELGKKVSDFMIEIAIRFALDINAIVPLSFVAAEPAHDDLVPLYQSNGFTELQEAKNTFFVLLKQVLV